MPPAAPSSAPVVLWTRSSTVSRRWQPWAIAAVTLLCGCGGFASLMARDPRAMGLMGGGFVFLVGAILVGPWLLRKARSHDRELTWDGTVLRCGAQAPVPTADLAGWAVRVGADQVVGTNGPSTKTPWMRLELRHEDGTISAFAWSHPRDVDALALRAAMASTFGPEAAG